MNAERYQRAKSVFFRACEQPPEARGAFVDVECDGDASLREAVMELLAHDDDPMTRVDALPMRELLEQLADSSSEAATGQSSVGSGNNDRRDDATLPQRIGRYRVLRVLGRGGMGVVYLAEQDNPRRQVALKVMARAHASRQTLRRFEHEAQILGRLHHPGIAQVYEAGMHDAGDGAQPYFAMELVRGRTLLEFCERSRATTRQRLELFGAICDAVQHAHTQGVVHRDLKPANILVEQRDEETPRHTDGSGSHDAGLGSSSVRLSVSASIPMIKILDFGVARLTDSDVQATTMHTAADQIIGTVAYMSPEQLSGAAEQVDTRSDVYALGVILFELLAGRLPHDVRDKTIVESIRIVGQDEPSSLASINRAYRGDLNTIVSRALERDKARRYPSAGELAADVRRHLRDEPILARPPTTLYQFRKFARRNKALVGGIAAVFAVLVGGIVATSWQAQQAIVARDKQTYLREVADHNAQIAAAQADKANTVVGFLQRMMWSADPHALKGRDYTVRQLLDDFALETNHALFSQQDVRATLLQTMGRAYVSLGEFKKAEPALREALEIRRGGGDLAALADTLIDLAVWQHATGDFTGGERTLREALEICQRDPDAPNMPTVQAMANLGDMMRHLGRTSDAIAMLEKAIARAREQRLASELTMSLSYLASALEDAGRSAEAEPLLRESLRLQVGPDEKPSVTAATTLANLGCLVGQLGDFKEGERLCREALELGRSQLGEDHPETAKRWNNLGLIMSESGRGDEAEKCFRAAIDIHRRHPEYDTTYLSVMLQNLSISQMNDLRWSDAEATIREAIALAESSDHAQATVVAERRAVLGEVLARSGRLSDGKALVSDALAVQREALGRTHPATLATQDRLADILMGEGQDDLAEPLMKEVLDERMKSPGPAHRDTVLVAAALARLMMRHGRFDEARACLEPVTPGAIQSLGPKHPATLHAWEALIDTYAGQGRWGEADALVARRIEAMRPALDANDPVLGEWLAMLGVSLHEQDRWDQAEPFLREAMTILRANGRPRPMTSRVTWRLGAALATQARNEEAEQLLLAGFEGIRDDPDVGASEKQQACDWIVTFYKKTDREDEAAKWRAVLEAIRLAGKR